MRNLDKRKRRQRVAYQRRNEVDAGHVVDVIDLHLARYAFLSTRLDRRLEDVRVVEMLHRLCAQVDAQVLEVGRLRERGKGLGRS